STTRHSSPHDLPVPCQGGRALGLPTQPPVVLPADRAEVAVRAVAALPVRDVDEEPAVADEGGEGGHRLLDVVAAAVRLLGGEDAYQTLLADLVHLRVAPQVVLDELEDRLGRRRAGHAVARRDGGREPEVEGRLELLAPARLRRERRLPVNAEAPLVVDDAERARPAVPVDAIELTPQHELGERDGRAGAQVLPFDDVVAGEDSQDLLGEVAERAAGEALEAGRRQAADRAGRPVGRERPHASLEPAHLALAVERREERPRAIVGER